MWSRYQIYHVHNFGMLYKNANIGRQQGLREQAHNSCIYSDELSILKLL